MSDLFANPLEEMIEFQDLKTDLQRGQGPLLVTGCLDSQKVHLLSELSDLTPWKLIVTYDDRGRGRSVRITGALIRIFRCTRRGICCFIRRISTETC